MAAGETGGGWLRWAGVASLVLFVAGPLSANQAMVPPLVGFILFVVGGLLGLVAAVTGLVKTFRRGLRTGQAGVILGIVPAVTLVWLAAGGREYPPINDITTDLENPPGFVHASSLPANEARDMGFPADFREVIRASYPDLGPLPLPDPPERVFDRAVMLARGVAGWQITLVNGRALTFEGVAISGLFRFQDDFVVRVTGADGGSRVDMRSKSRDGRGDMGANARRIREFFAKLRASS
ncbi:MAG: DUF1499 domain-containing protein [Candidatus Binatia bacterium]